MDPSHRSGPDQWPAGRSLSPSPSDRARLAWLDDPEASSAEIALRARCSTGQAGGVRRSLVSYGVLAPRREPVRRFPRHLPLPPAPRALMQGSCVGVLPSLWCSDDRADRAEAKRVCVLDCPVQQACLDWAVEAVPASDTAIYGGFSASQRARLARARGIARPAVSGIPAIEAAMTCCPACGEALSGENLITEPGRRPGTVRRRCRACTRTRKATYHATQREAAGGAG